jgi:hypothetical protein
MVSFGKRMWEKVGVCVLMGEGREGFGKLIR